MLIYTNFFLKAQQIYLNSTNICVTILFLYTLNYTILLRSTFPFLGSQFLGFIFKPFYLFIDKIEYVINKFVF